MSQLFGGLYIYCSIVYNIILGSDIQHDSIFFLGCTPFKVIKYCLYSLYNLSL